MKAAPVRSSTVKLLAILDDFGEEGLKSYVVGHSEGFDDAMEGMAEEEGAYGTLRGTLPLYVGTTRTRAALGRAEERAGRGEIRWACCHRCPQQSSAS